MTKSVTPESILDIAINALEDLKAVNIKVLSVSKLTDIADYMVISSGTSTRHVKSIADNVVRNSKKQGIQPFGVEGEQAGEWILVDLGDVIVHVLLPEMREFYSIEKLWAELPIDTAAESSKYP